MSISEFDQVRITRAIPGSRVHRGRPPVAWTPLAGDLATVVFAYPATAEHLPLFMVESVEMRGGRRWLADVLLSEVERVESWEGAKTKAA